MKKSNQLLYHLKTLADFETFFLSSEFINLPVSIHQLFHCTGLSRRNARWLLFWGRRRVSAGPTNPSQQYNCATNSTWDKGNNYIILITPYGQLRQHQICICLIYVFYYGSLFLCFENSHHQDVSFHVQIHSFMIAQQLLFIFS